MDETYYKELHAALRHYDLKIWSVIASLLVVVGWGIGSFDYEKLWIPKNAVILLGGSVFLFFLLLKFIKEHAYTLFIQKKINEFDDVFNKDPKHTEEQAALRRVPIFSRPSNFGEEYSDTQMLLDLKTRFKKDPYFHSIPGEERLLRWPVSTIFIRLILLLSIGGFVGGLFIVWNIVF